ncbi:MAG: glycerophosphodiester phosphodiesterase family protein [Geminicoccaceae bacterium]
MRIANMIVAATVASGATLAHADEVAVQLGPRPFYLVERLDDGPLKEKLRACADGPFQRSTFSIGHRGAPLQFPEHTKESYEAAAVMGAGVVECDVTFTKDRQLVCRHSQCDLHTTTNILAVPELAAKCSEPFTPAEPATGRKASAKCCTSGITMSEFKSLKGKMDAFDPQATTVETYMAATAPWRTDLYASSGTLMTHAESIALLKRLGVKFTPELKAPSVAMPYDGNYTQAAYAQQMIDEYKAAGVAPGDVFAQSFNLADIKYWLAQDPEFGAQAVYLDDRDEMAALDPMREETWKPSMAELKAAGVGILAPPIWYMLRLDDAGKMVPSPYARAAKEAGLELIGWSFERSGPLTDGGGWYYQSVKDAIKKDADMMVALDTLAQQVGIKAMFSDWPATVTYYANCMNLK